MVVIDPYPRLQKLHHQYSAFCVILILNEHHSNPEQLKKPSQAKKPLLLDQKAVKAMLG